MRQIKHIGHHYWNYWIQKRSPVSNPQILSSNNVYILPSGFGCAYALIVLTLFSGAINYQISTIFLMTFLLAVIGLVSAWEAHANLKELSVKMIAIKDAPLGQPAEVTLLIRANTKIRFGIEFKLPHQPSTRVEKIAPGELLFTLPIETTQRGCFSLPRIRISSLFPFGLFRVWGYASFNTTYYVYPDPVSTEFWPMPVAIPEKEKKNTPGDNEFYDLKQVENPWQQPNLIAWKIAAKGQGWYLKMHDSTEGDYWLFRLNDSPAQELETKLQHLSYWLIHAELNHWMYCLELGPSRMNFDQGEEHLHHCLRQLALY